jgi:hypothetical protein
VAELLLIVVFVSLFKNTHIMSDPLRHSSLQSNCYTLLEEIVLPALSPITPVPAPPFVAYPAPKSEAETANIFGTDPWANVQATPMPRCTCPSTRHTSCAPTPFVPEPLKSTYHWNSQTYGTLKDVVIASSRNFGISNNLTQWPNIVIKEFTCCNVVIGYNTLGNWIQAVDTCIAESMNEFKAAVYMLWSRALANTNHRAVKPRHRLKVVIVRQQARVLGEHCSQ